MNKIAKQGSDAAAPTAIVLADKLSQGEVRDIFGDIEVSSLLIAGKTVLEHTLLELQEIGVRHCLVFAGKNADKIRCLVGREGYWGMTVTVMNHVVCVEEALRKYRALCSSKGLLVIEADRLRSFCITEFLSRVSGEKHGVVELISGGEKVGITLLRSSCPVRVSYRNSLAVNNVLMNKFENAKAFHAANFDVLSGKFRGVEPKVMFNKLLGRRQHWASDMSVSNFKALLGLSIGRENNKWSNVMIDRNCKIGQQVQLGSVILNRDVYIESGAELHKTIVMPNSIVSSARDISNSIVSRDAVFDLG